MILYNKITSHTGTHRGAFFCGLKTEMTINEARKKLKDDKLSDQQIENILVKLRILCERAIDKTINKNGKT